MATTSPPGLPPFADTEVRRSVRPLTRAGWRDWLERNAASAPGVWLLLEKRGERGRRVSLTDAVDEALCFGWADTHLRPVDAGCFAVLFAPRRPGSTWPSAERARTAELAAGGLLTEAGRRAVDRAVADGSWDRLDPADVTPLPDDLVAALAARGRARRNFDRHIPAARKAALCWVLSAGRPRTRASRVAEVARLAAADKTILQR